MPRPPMAKTNSINQKRLSSSLGVKSVLDDVVASKIHSMDKQYVLCGTVTEIYESSNGNKWLVKVKRSMSTDPPYVCQMLNDDPDITMGSLPQVGDEVQFQLPYANKSYLPTICGISSQSAGKLKPDETMNYRKEGEIRSQVGGNSISLDSEKVVVGDTTSETEDPVLRKSDLESIRAWIAISLSSTVPPALPQHLFIIPEIPPANVAGSTKLKVTG